MEPTPIECSAFTNMSDIMGWANVSVADTTELAALVDMSLDEFMVSHPRMVAGIPAEFGPHPSAAGNSRMATVQASKGLPSTGVGAYCTKVGRG